MHHGIGVTQIVVGIGTRAKLNRALECINCIRITSFQTVCSSEVEISAIVVRRELRRLQKHAGSVGIPCLVVVEKAEPVVYSPIIWTERDCFLVGCLGGGNVPQVGVGIGQAS